MSDATNVTLPIIYVRGFAGTSSGINAAADDPFYGFNLGSTHVRIDASNKPQFYQFEGPLLRLMAEENYNALAYGDQIAWLNSQPDNTVDPARIWIHRFYDVSASTFGRDAEEYCNSRLLLRCLASDRDPARLRSDGKRLRSRRSPLRP